MLLLDFMLPGRAPTFARLVIAAGVAVSCGGATPPPAPAAPLQSAPVVQLPPPPDLRPVPDPAGLVVSGRIGNLSGIFATVRAWSNLPMPQSDQLTEILTGEAVGPLIDLDQPIDFAVATTGTGTHIAAQVAVAAAVKDADAARTALSDRFKLAPGDNGVLVIQGLGRRSLHDDADQDDSDGDDKDHRTCELAPAYGAAPVRLVCGIDAGTLAALGPWLTRTATRAPAGSDVHVDVRLRPLKPAIPGLKRTFSVLAGGVLGPSGASGVRDAAMGLANDFVDSLLDLDTVSFDGQLSDAGAGLTTTTRFSGHTSAFTRMMIGHADGGVPTPAAFWRLPDDTDLAMFTRGMDPNDLGHVRELVLKLLDGKLTEDGVPEADRKLLVEALGKIPSSSPALYASGVDLDAVKKARGAIAALGTAPDRALELEAARVLSEALLGWHFVELEEASPRLSGAIKDLSAAWSRPGFAGVYRAKSKGGPLPTIRTAPVPKATSLPKGSQHYVIEVPFEPEASEPKVAGALAVGPGKGAARQPKGRSKPLLVHLFLAGDAQRTWLAFGGEEAFVASKLGAAIAGSPANPRADLGFFKDARTDGAGFITLRTGSVFAEQAAVLSRELGLGSSTLDALDDLAHVPHGGNTPIVYSFTAKAGGSPATVVSQVQVPRAAIEDSIVGILRHGGF